MPKYRQALPASTVSFPSLCLCLDGRNDQGFSILEFIAKGDRFHGTVIAVLESVIAQSYQMFFRA
ncbi:hypothetical protein NITLEN_20151 [Nitrospira lenta]|uniref:Uncharacterized protein n=1 Tax=Nitrospira lenta TaxID=1436998 RepID=A0A330L415_9BACT|nr:hypothetical protein NITLEN_20151 [Nitrospira lenta]